MPSRIGEAGDPGSCHGGLRLLQASNARVLTRRPQRNRSPRGAVIEPRSGCLRVLQARGHAGRSIIRRGIAEELCCASALSMAATSFEMLDRLLSKLVSVHVL